MLDNLPILVTGFESSGTTLLRRLVSMHPDLPKDLFHENRKLLMYKTAQEAENNYYDEFSHIKCGEKIPYVKTDFVIMYIDKWKEFWPDSFIFHIIRETEEVVESCHRRFNRPKNIIRNMHIDAVNEIGEHIKETGNFQNIPYAVLIAKPFETLKNVIYSRMGNVPDDDYIRKVISTKEVWQWKDKRNAGLRYSFKVGKINHKGEDGK